MTNQLLYFLNKCIGSKLVNSFVLCLSIVITQAALAEYQPPPDQRPPGGYTSTTGPRGGCEASQGTSLTVLAPQRHVGRTVSTHPTFAWFVPDIKPFALEFTLYELNPGSVLKLAQKISLQSSPGIMQLSLPKDKPGLAVGQRYLWQVAMICDHNHPSSDLVAKAEIEVVEMPPDLKRTLFTEMDRLKIADLHAEAGLWYDALHAALEPTKDSRLGEVASTLLENLAKLEEPEAAQIESAQSSNLRRIASSERQQSSPHSP